MKFLPAAVLAVFVALAGYYSLVIPPWEAVDEIDHYHYAQFLLSHGALPALSTHGESQEVLLAHHPPLYYALLALVIAPVDHANPKDIGRTNFDWRWGDPNYGGHNRFFHGDASEQFPYSGSIRGVHVARLFSVLGGTLVLFATWRTARILLGSRAFGLAATAMAIVALLPGFLVTSATVHHDSWVAALGALAIWRTLAYLQGLSVTNLGAAAALLALAALTKASALVLAPLLPLAVALAWMRTRGPDRSPATSLPHQFVQLGAAAGIYLVIIGWWLIRNQALYGDPLGWAAFTSSPLWPVEQKPINPGSILGELWDEWAPGSSFWRTLVFGAGQMVFGNDLILNLVFAATSIGLAGLVFLAVDGRHAAETWSPPAVLLAIAVLLVITGIVRYSLTFFGPNGRYLFPVLPILSLGMVVGWRAILPRIARVPMAALSAAGLAALALLTPSVLFLPNYALANRLDAAGLAQLQLNQAVTYGGRIQLVQATVTPQRADPGSALHARLVWRALEDIPRSYRTFVHVLSLEGAKVGGVDRVPAAGAASTGLWRQGDVVFDDFEVPLSANTGPGIYRVVSGFYQFPDLARLPASGPQAVSGDVALLGQVKLLPRAVWGGEPTARFGDQLALARVELAPRLPRVGEDLEVRLLWLAEQRPRTDYTVSVQLLTLEGALLAQRDSPPLSGALPTTAWEPGDLIPDTVALRVPPGTPMRFAAHLVVYASATGERLPVQGGDSLLLGTLTLEPQ